MYVALCGVVRGMTQYVVWYGMVWCRAARRGVARRGAAWHGVVRRGAAWRSVARCVARCGAAWRGVARCGAAWHGVVSYAMARCAAVRDAVQPTQTCSAAACGCGSRPSQSSPRWGERAKAPANGLALRASSTSCQGSDPMTPWMLSDCVGRLTPAAHLGSKLQGSRRHPRQPVACPRPLRPLPPWSNRGLEMSPARCVSSWCAGWDDRAPRRLARESVRPPAEQKLWEAGIPKIKQNERALVSRQ